MQDLGGRVAVVTGAASGVGRGIASVLAQEGARVALVDIDLAAAEAVARELAGAGGTVTAIAGDVTDRASMDAAAATVLERFGGIDIVAANAGIYPEITIDEMTSADFDRVMGINVKGVLHTVQACLPALRAQPYGRIVITSSITGPLAGAPNLSAYAASKSALLGFMRSAALELVRDGITVNAVQPGNVATPGILDEFSPEFLAAMTAAIPVGRLAEPAEIGWAVRFLASEEAGYITGQTIVLDGGQMLPEGNWEP